MILTNGASGKIAVSRGEHTLCEMGG
jgi:hypothetical protein